MVNKIIEVDRTPKVIKIRKAYVPTRRYYYTVNNETFTSLKELKDVYSGYKIIIKDCP